MVQSLRAAVPGGSKALRGEAAPALLEELAQVLRFNPGKTYQDGRPTLVVIG